MGGGDDEPGEACLCATLKAAGIFTCTAVKFLMGYSLITSLFN
jgi:hypothetical protein